VPTRTKKKSKQQAEPTTSDHTHAAYMGIRRMLFHKEVVPGQKIAYRDLAKRVGMSPTPVVHALKWLEFQGIVQHVPNRGYYIAPFSLEEVREIYDFRETIEVALLPEAIKRLDEEGIKRLRAALEAHLSATRETYLNERLLKDMEFHLTLASLSQRHIHRQTLRNLFDLLYLKYRGSDLSARPMDTVDYEHKKIFEAVVSQDLQKAQKVLSQHLSEVKNKVLARLERMIKDKETYEF
jgi:DNA-binding GntR family transcriptional regulator